MSNRQVILIMTDTTRFDMLGCAGYPDMYTPNLDALARDGVRYDRAYTCQPVCGPARSAIFTGQYPHTTGGWTNCVSQYDDIKTVGQRLSAAGIHCGYVGKWHLDGGDYFGNGVCPPGWDPEYWYDMHNYLNELSDTDRVRSRRTDSMDADGGIPASLTFGRRVTDRALDFLERFGSEEYFLTVSYDEPHDPYLCPEPYASMYRDYTIAHRRNMDDDLSRKPPHQQAWAAYFAQTGRRYVDAQTLAMYRCNSFIDGEIGRVISKIRAVSPDALILFTSDHGDALGAHRISGKGPVAYDEVARIPLIISGGGAAGLVYPHPVSHIDLVPTILDSMGLDIPVTLPGKSLLSTAAGSSAPVNDAVYIEFGRYEIDHDGFGGFQPMRSIFDGRYKLTVNLLSTDELYDLYSDPDEMENLISAPETAAVRDALHDRLLDHMNRTRDPFRGWYWERRPWRSDARPATWSYTGWTRQREPEPGEQRQYDYDTGLPMQAAARPKQTR